MRPTVACICGRTMTPDPLRGVGAYRCGCGARVKVTVTDIKRCGGYRNGNRCRSAIAAGLPVDLCVYHAQELRELWKLDFAAHQRAADEQQYGAEAVNRPEVWLMPPKPAHPPIVYYLLFADRIKIGTTTNLNQRLGSIPHDELLGTEPGDEALERRRHQQFAHLRITGEWFRASKELWAHIEEVRGQG